MKVIEKIEKKIIDLQKYVDAKNDKLSTVIKYFQEEIRELEESGFSKKEQIKILSLAFDRSIKYTTYIDLYKKYVNTKVEQKVESSDFENNSTKEAQPEVTNEPKKEQKKNSIFDTTIEDQIMPLKKAKTSKFK